MPCFYLQTENNTLSHYGGHHWSVMWWAALAVCVLQEHCQVPDPSAESWSSGGIAVQGDYGLSFTVNRAVSVLQVFLHGVGHKQRHVTVRAALQALSATKIGAGRKKG